MMNKIDSLWGNIFKNKNDQTTRISAMLLKNIPLFAELRKRELREIERLIHRRQYKNGEVIFWEDEPGVGMYIVQKGEVGILQGLRHARNKSSWPAWSRAIFSAKWPCWKTTAARPRPWPLANRHLLGLFHPDLFDLFERKPQLGIKVLSTLANMLAQRLRKTNLDLQELAKNPPPAETKKSRPPNEPAGGKQEHRHQFEPRLHLFSCSRRPSSSCWRCWPRPGSCPTAASC